jgi:hypothetical protein
VVSVRRVPRHAEPGRRERADRGVEETRDHREAALVSIRVVAAHAADGRAVGMPVVRVVVGGRGVAHALESADPAAVGPDLAPVEHRHRPSELVALAVVCRVARADGEGERLSRRRPHPQSVDCLNGGVGDLRRQELLRSIRGAERRLRQDVQGAVEVLDAGRRLGVLHVDIGEVHERRESPPGPFPGRRRRAADVGVDHVRLTRSGLVQAIAARGHMRAQQGAVERRAGGVSGRENPLTPSGLSSRTR